MRPLGPRRGNGVVAGRGCGELLLVLEEATRGEICTMMILKMSLKKIIMGCTRMADFVAKEIMVVNGTRRRGLVN